VLTLNLHDIVSIIDIVTANVEVVNQAEEGRSDSCIGRATFHIVTQDSCSADLFNALFNVPEAIKIEQKYIVVGRDFVVAHSAILFLDDSRAAIVLGPAAALVRELCLVLAPVAVIKVPCVHKKGKKAHHDQTEHEKQVQLVDEPADYGAAF